MEGWVAITHSDWFDFLAQQPRRDAVNFWSPSDHYTFHGTPGAPFFFKLKAPRNAIGGFGFVASYSRLPEWLASRQSALQIAGRPTTSPGMEDSWIEKNF